MPSEPLEKRKRFFKNTLYGLLSWLLPIVPTMIATPIVLEKLGTQQYGVLVVIIGFISYFFTTSIGKVAAKYVAEYKATGETEKISPVISATIILGVSITLFGGLGTVIFVRYLVVEILSIPVHLQDQAVIGLYLACATILSIVVGQIFQLVLQGLHRFDRFLLLANLTSVSFSLGSIVVVLLGYGIVALLAWNLITWLIVCSVSYFTARKLLPEYRFTFQIPGEIWRSVGRYAASIIAFQLFGNVLLLFERGWIMRQFGGDAMSFYAIPMTLAMYLHLFTASLVLAMFPTVNELLKEPDKLKSLYQKSTKLILCLLAFAVLSVIVCGRMFLTVWLKEDFASGSYLLLAIHIVTFAILALNTIVWQIAESFHAASLNAYATLIWMVVGITLMIALSGEWQTTGVAAGRLIGALIFVPLIFYVERHYLGGNLWRFWGSVTGRILLACVPAVIAEWLIVHTFRSSWLTFLAAIVIGSSFYVGTLLITGFFDDSEKQLLRDLATRFR